MPKFVSLLSLHAIAILLLVPSRCFSAGKNTSTKRILVTGGNKGIGKAICQKLLKDHPDVHVLLGSRDPGRGERAIQDITSALGPNECKGRLQLIQLDTSSDESVQEAATSLTRDGCTLYGIINNAGVGPGATLNDALSTNFFGPKRVNDAFGVLLQRPGGRIVNIASASGPVFVEYCNDAPLREYLTEPLTASGIDELVQVAEETKGVRDTYGFSKALLNAYTVLLAKSEPDLIVNSCTPGYIDTDMTRGAGATNPPSKGAVPPVWLAMSDVLLDRPTGWYYGSDCVRSPLHEYRGPGDPPYEGP